MSERHPSFAGHMDAAFAAINQRRAELEEHETWKTRAERAAWMATLMCDAEDDAVAKRRPPQHPLIRAWMRAGQRVLAPRGRGVEYLYARIQAVDPVLGSMVLWSEMYMTPSGPWPMRHDLVTADRLGMFFPVDEDGDPLDQREEAAL